MKKAKTKESILGGKIHKLLNKTLSAKLTMTEYTQLVLLIAAVFDLKKKKK